MKSLRMKILVPILILTLIGLTSLSVFSFIKARTAVTAEIESLTNTKAEKLIAEVNNQLDEWKDILELVATDTYALNMEKEKLMEHILNDTDLEKVFETIFISDITGESYDGYKYFSVADRSYFGKSLKGDFVFSDILVSKTTGNNIIVAVAPISDKSGKVIGIVGGTVTIEDLTNIVISEKLGVTGYGYMIDSNGILIAHPTDEIVLKHTSEIFNSNDELLKHIDKMVAGEDNLAYYTYNGDEKIMSYGSIELTGWSVAISAKVNEMTKGIDGLKSYAIIISAMILIVMVLTILYIISRVTKPLLVIVSGIKKLRKGNLQVNFSNDSKDEVGVISREMNDFADYLKNNVVGSMNLIASGNVNFELEAMGEDDEITPSLQTMVSTIKTLIEEMNNMSEQHDLGEIDVIVDENKFEGSYKELAKGMNNMVDGYKELNKKAMTCVEEFSNGNFEAELEKFPGKKAFINDAIEGLRDNLKNVNKEIGTLVTASIEGILDTRADETVFAGDWKELISGLNQLLNEIIEPIKESSDVLSEMANGNLQSRVVGDYKGDHAVIKNALNETLESLGTYILEISNVLSEMSNSNLDLEIVNDYKGDFAPIKDGLNLIINSFNSILSDMNNAADQVASGAGQVSDGSNELSQGATEQASSIEELTSSITQIAAQTKQNATNAGEANNLALDAKTDAEEGNNQMKEMLTSMDEINEASNNIAKIIKVIDEIAFQTNILALNAAVEAARAGQHGKGFAVVAEEVRNLAQRSANAAQETTDLIEGSMKKVETGTEIANKTAEALEKIVDGVSKAAELVGQIAEASNEQATGITQINQGIEQVAKVTQTNSATAEESAAASEELSGQAGLLKEMVSQFNIKNNSYSQPVKSLPGKVQHDEAALTSDKPQINLTDDEFGKY